MTEVAKQITTLSARCRQAARRPDWEVVEVWANVQRNGGANSHPGSFWAGVYYVDVGETCSTQEKGGELQIYDPRGCLPRMLAPYLQYNMAELHDARTSISYTPAPGQCLLFPDWLFHAVNTYRGTAPRISVAFNLAPVITTDSHAAVGAERSTTRTVPAPSRAHSRAPSPDDAAR